MTENQKWNRKSPTPSGGIYGLAFIGAAIYFIQHSTTFWEGVVGVLKAFGVASSAHLQMPRVFKDVMNEKQLTKKLLKKFSIQSLQK